MFSKVKSKVTRI